MSGHLQARAAMFRDFSRWMACETEQPPQGKSTPILPGILGKRCWDTAPHAYEFSEYGNDAGLVQDNQQKGPSWRAR